MVPILPLCTPPLSSQFPVFTRLLRFCSFYNFLLVYEVLSDFFFFLDCVKFLFLLTICNGFQNGSKWITYLVETKIYFNLLFYFNVRE